MQHFDLHNSNQKKEKEKKEKKIFNLQSFSNTCNIMKPFELAQGKFMDIKYDYN